MRETSIEWPGHEDWDRYLNVFGRLNRGIGQVAAFGSMALSHVTAREMGKMLGKKYPKLYEQRRSTIQLQRRIADNFNQFVQRQEKNEIEALETAAERERWQLESEDIAAVMGRLAEENEESRYDIVLEACQEPTGIQWGVGILAVRGGLQKFSRNALGLDLTANDQLYAEHHTVVGYCKDEGLDTRCIDPNWEPHISVIGTYGIAGSVELKQSAHPDTVVLDPPRALVNNNTPPGTHY